MTAALILPQQLPTAGGWSLSDYHQLSITSEPADSLGVAVATGPQLEPGYLWLMDHMVASCSSTGPTRMRLYDGPASPGTLLDGTDTGNFDVADWPAGLQLQPSRYLVAVWTGADPGARGVLTVQVRVLRAG